MMYILQKKKRQTKATEAHLLMKFFSFIPVIILSETTQSISYNLEQEPQLTDCRFIELH